MPSKIEGPLTCISFLGIIIDTIDMQLSISEDRPRINYVDVHG